MLKRINGVLPDLVWGILGYGLILQLAGVWFTTDKISYSMGLWLGIVIAIGLAIHMAVVIRDTMDPDRAEQAVGRRAFFSISRYVVVIILFVIVLYFELGNAIAMFIGILGLKAAAYLQPLTHRLKEVLKRKGPENNNQENNDKKETSK